MEKINVLIVEDEPIIALDLKRALTKLNYQVLDMVSSGEAALHFIEKQSPDIILMDEPASGLINAEIDEIDNTLRMLSKEMNIAVIIVEHRIELLETIADRVVVMDAGEIIAEGNLEDVINNPKVKEAYFEG